MKGDAHSAGYARFDTHAACTRRQTALCPVLSVRTCAPSSRRHRRTVLSSDPVTTCLPSGVTHTDVTQSRCPFSVCTCVHWPQGCPRREVSQPSGGGAHRCQTGARR
eukprot:5452730-Pleurochrysis_carterae.AAC.1